MMRKLGWLALVLALAVPAAAAWGADGKSGKAEGSGCCCFCDRTCPR
jgi:hypothetical protein